MLAVAPLEKCGGGLPPVAVGTENHDRVASRGNASERRGTDRSDRGLREHGLRSIHQPGQHHRIAGNGLATIDRRDHDRPVAALKVLRHGAAGTDHNAGRDGKVACELVAATSNLPGWTIKKLYLPVASDTAETIPWLDW